MKDLLRDYSVNLDFLIIIGLHTKTVLKTFDILKSDPINPLKSGVQLTHFHPTDGKTR